MIEKQPLVTIVLPTYNGSKYIKQSIDSCLNQTYRNIELIIMDDGSTDETPEIIKFYKDERIKIITHKMNKGLSTALNRGFAQSKGEYLTWTSDDNYYVENAIERMLEFLKEKKCDFVYTDFYGFSEDSLNITSITLPKNPELEKRNTIGPCFIYSRCVKENVGDYDPSIILAEDYDYWIRISKKYKMYHLPSPLYYYRNHFGSLSSRVAKGYRDYILIDLLIRFKNDIEKDIDKALSITLDGIIISKINEKSIRKKILSHHITKISYIKMTKIYLFNKVKKIFINYKKKHINFKSARHQLMKLLS